MMKTEAKHVIESARKASALIATAESCTGGMIAAMLTDIPGASDVFDRGFVTYSNTAKMQMLGVDEKLIAEHGAVSAETAEAMAVGAAQAIPHSEGKTRAAISTTGIAGPAGATASKPVGLVWFGLAVLVDDAPDTIAQVQSIKNIFAGERNDIRESAAHYGLQLLRGVF